MVILVIDVLIVGMNLLGLNGLDIVMVGDVDLQQWEVVHQMLVFRMALLMGITPIITFLQQDQTKDQLGSHYLHFATKTVLLLTMDTRIIGMNLSNKGIIA